MHAHSLPWVIICHMKFSDVQTGQRFRYQDKSYLKVTPLMAIAEGEPNQRLIARSARVEILDKPQKETKLAQTLSREQVDQSMQSLSASLKQIVAESGLSAEQSNKILQQMQTAFDQCLRSLQ